jgi:hypothetical protein
MRDNRKLQPKKLMSFFNENEPPQPLNLTGGDAVGNPHTLYNNFLTNHFEMHKKRRLEDYEKYKNRITNV